MLVKHVGWLAAGIIASIASVTTWPARQFQEFPFIGLLTAGTRRAGPITKPWEPKVAKEVPGAIVARPPRPEDPAGASTLLRADDLTYAGSFRFPAGPIAGSAFSYGGTALAFNSTRGSLFLVGHDWQQQVAEIAIPGIHNDSSIDGLETATVLQPFSDATEGRLSTVDEGNVKVGGLLHYGGQLYLTAYSYYDADASQTLSHFVRTPDLRVQGSVRGPYQVGAIGAGVVSGYLGLVPQAWRTALGGPVLNGQCCLGIVSRTSYGPALFAMDPARLGASKPLDATPLVYYPQSNPLADWDSTNPYFNGTSEVRAVVFPEGTRSVLFFGRHGRGPFCYGPGTDDKTQEGKQADGGADTYCFDPADGNKGTHGYPYVYQVWAYDALDFADVTKGSRRPWDVKPYAVWNLDLPFAHPSAHLSGAAYDPASGRIFVTAAYGDGELPLVHVLNVQAR